jgi:hypothetical protein
MWWKTARKLTVFGLAQRKPGVSKPRLNIDLVAERFLLILAKICVEKILLCGADVQNGLLWDLVSYECLDRFSF